MPFRVLETYYDRRRRDPKTNNHSLDHIEFKGTYDTYESAKEAAIQARKSNTYFQEWENTMEETGQDDMVDELPFDSLEIGNEQHDMAVLLWVEDLGSCYDEQDHDDFGKETVGLDENSRAPANQIDVEQADERAPPSPQEYSVKKPKEKKTLKPRLFGRCDKVLDVHDPDLFWSHPSRLVPPAVSLAATHFPGGRSRTGYVDLIRRNSDALYACKSVANDGAGVQFTFRHAKHRHLVPSLVWIPAEGCNLAGQKFHDKSIVDTVHTDLIDSTNGLPRVVPDHLTLWCSASVKHLMLNKFSSDGQLTERESHVVAQAIRSCASLKTFCITEWTNVNATILRGLAEVGPSLRGIHMATCYLQDYDAYDALIDLLRVCPNLKWLGLDLLGDFEYTPELWEVLSHKLVVLYLRGGAENGVHDLEPPRGLSKRLPYLKLRLIFPDDKFKSK